VSGSAIVFTISTPGAGSLAAVKLLRKAASSDEMRPIRQKKKKRKLPAQYGEGTDAHAFGGETKNLTVVCGWNAIHATPISTFFPFSTFDFAFLSTPCPRAILSPSRVSFIVIVNPTIFVVVTLSVALTRDGVAARLRSIALKRNGDRHIVGTLFGHQPDDVDQDGA
jgi:hypothetical protein